MIQLRHVQKYCCNVTTTTSTTTTTTTIAENYYMVTSCDGVYTYVVDSATQLNTGDIFTTSTVPLNNTCYSVVSKTAQTPQVVINVDNFYGNCDNCLNNYTVVADKTNVDEGASVNFTISNSFGADDTLTFEVKTTDGYTVEGRFTPNDVVLNSGNIVFANGTGSFTISAVADGLTEGFHSFYVQIYKNGVSVAISSAITINDTSTGNPLNWSVKKVAGATSMFPIGSTVSVNNLLYKIPGVQVGKFVQLLGSVYSGCWEIIAGGSILPADAIVSVHDTSVC